MIIVKSNPRNENVFQLIQELDEYQSSLYPAESNHLDSVETLVQDNVYFVSAFFEDNPNPIACGAVKIIENYGEVKRVYVVPNYRGKGVAKAIMKALEEHLVNNRILIAKLETGIYQEEAISFYKSLGYKFTLPFGEYKPDPLSVFMEKLLAT